MLPCPRGRTCAPLAWQSVPELIIIIVSYNTRDCLDACLRSLHAPAPRCSHTIVVVDNGSRDGSVARVRAAWPAVRVIDAGRNLGYAAANNAAIRATDSELLLLLNSDTLVPPGAVDRLVTQLRVRAEAAAVGPRLTDADGNVELSWGPPVTPWSAAWRKLQGALLARRVPALSAWIAAAASRARYAAWLSGACLLVRRADAHAVGLLDERFFLYFEDVDFCLALRRRGRRMRFVPEVTVIHHRGRSGAGEPAGTRTAYRRSQLAFYRKHHPAWVPLLRLYLRARRALPSPLL